MLERAGFFARKRELKNEPWYQLWFDAGQQDVTYFLALLVELGLATVAATATLCQRRRTLIKGMYNPYAHALLDKKIDINFLINLPDDKLAILEDRHVRISITGGKQTIYGAVGITEESLNLKEGSPMPISVIPQAGAVMKVDALNPGIGEPYKIISERDNGAIYTAHWKGENVALKRMRISIDNGQRVKSGASLKDALKEIRIFAHFSELNAPYMIRLKGYYFYEHHYLLIMELASNGDLESWIRDRPTLALSVRLNMLCQLAEAISYMHEAGYVHCDIKSENVFIAEQMQVKLGDFGLSEYIKEAPSVRCAGSLYYSAPELLKIKHGGNTYATDCYSYAMTACEMVNWALNTRAPEYTKYKTLGEFTAAVIAGVRPALYGDAPDVVKDTIRGGWEGDAQVRSEVKHMLGLFRAALVVEPVEPSEKNEATLRK